MASPLLRDLRSMPAAAYLGDMRGLVTDLTSLRRGAALL
jgi:hypothetical protein